MKLAQILFAALLVSSPQMVRSESLPSGTHPSMGEFTTALRIATSRIATDRNEELLAAARALSVAAKSTEGLSPSANGEMSESFDRYLEDLRSLSGDLVTHVERCQTPRAVSALQEIRNTCVRCHTIFRPDVDSIYPNQGNIIHGQVTLERMDGDMRSDRSNVVVFLDHAPERHLHRSRFTISQGDRVFSPRVTAVVKGTTVEFPNDDTIFHNCFLSVQNQAVRSRHLSSRRIKVGHFRQTGVGESLLQYPSEHGCPRYCPGQLLFFRLGRDGQLCHTQCSGWPVQHPNLARIREQPEEKGQRSGWSRPGRRLPDSGGHAAASSSQ